MSEITNCQRKMNIPEVIRIAVEAYPSMGVTTREGMRELGDNASEP